MVSKEVIVIPTYARPEVLAHALDKISNCHDAPDDVRIFLDYSPESRVREVEYVRDKFLPRALVFHAKPHASVTSGTFNILHSLKAGWETGAELVWLVEEDVMCFPGMFDRGRKEMATGKWLAFCGRLLEPFAARYGTMYTNPGAVLSRRLLDNVVPHICDAYFADTGGYIREVFKHEPFNSSLDDGLIRMVVREMGGACGYPERPICAHQGFNWYDEIDIYSNHGGSLDDRIAKFKVITDSMKPTDRYAGDFEPFILTPTILFPLR